MLDRHLDDYRPIILLNIDLKILVNITKECLQSTAEIMLGPEQTCVVKSRTIQSNQQLIHTILEGLEEDGEAALINLDQSKAPETVDNQYLATVVRLNVKCSSDFALSQWVCKNCPVSRLLYALLLDPFLSPVEGQGM